MRQVYKIKIGTLWLCEGGIETGKKCDSEILNLSRLFESYTRTVIEACDGSQVVQTFENKDVLFSIQTRVPKSLGISLTALFNNPAYVSPAVLPFTGSDGAAADLSFDIELVSLDFKDSKSDIWDNVQINLIKKG